jgi:hypothetical protein
LRSWQLALRFMQRPRVDFAGRTKAARSAKGEGSERGEPQSQIRHLGQGNNQGWVLGLVKEEPVARTLFCCREFMPRNFISDLSAVNCFWDRRFGA